MPNKRVVELALQAKQLEWDIRNDVPLFSRLISLCNRVKTAPNFTSPDRVIDAIDEFEACVTQTLRQFAPQIMDASHE